MAEIITQAVNNPNITPVGEFLVGSLSTFYFTFPTESGDLFDPATIDIVILDSASTVITTAATVEKLDPGYYAWSWTIPTTTIPGAYYLKVNYVAEEITGPVSYTYTEAFVITQANGTYIDQQALAWRRYLETFLGYTQRIPVFNEIGRLNLDRTVAEFTFPRWNQPSSQRVFLNGRLFDPSNYQTDYMNGKIKFLHPLLEQDEVTANYNFRWFTDDELDLFIAQGTQIFNSYPPVSAYNPYLLPMQYTTTALEQAAIIALRRIIMDLMFVEPQKVVGGPSQADKIIGSLETLKQNYEGEVTKLLEQKKNGPYVGLTRTITTSAFALPGSRSRWFRLMFSTNT